jgi:hypothetical protein
LEKLIAENYYLNRSAKDAYKAYIRAYDSHQMKQIFDVNKLDLVAVCKSFGFPVPPFVDLRMFLFAFLLFMGSTLNVIHFLQPFHQNRKCLDNIRQVRYLVARRVKIKRRFISNCRVIRKVMVVVNLFVDCFSCFLVVVVIQMLLYPHTFVVFIRIYLSKENQGC